MKYRTLTVLSLRVLLISAMTASLSNAEPYLFGDPPFPLELNDGGVLTITSIEIQHDRDGRKMFIYKTVSGEEGYKWQDQIANSDQLMNAMSPVERPFFHETIDESTGSDSSQESAGTESTGIVTTKDSGRIDIEDRCEQQWGTENAMLEECVNQQLKAARWIQDNYTYKADVTKAEHRIINGCAKKWIDQINEKSIYDFVKIKECIEQQLQAYTEVQ